MSARNEPRPELAAVYDLRPHPEGGWYRRTWTAPDSIRRILPDGTERVRAAATLILFYLDPGECSAWHRVASDEVWIWTGAGPISVQLGGHSNTPSDNNPNNNNPVTVLGPDPRAGHQPQLLVPAGVWQRTLPSTEPGLASCLVSPGFDFADFTLASS
ncbi:MAG TPA: cupin domain-containing protein [Pseudonocardia sp.]|jgi:hypothetical protein